MKNLFKLSFAAVLVSAAMQANAGISIVDNEQGNFAIGGNIELNFNYRNRDSNPNGDEEFNQDGRVLIEFLGEKYARNDHYVRMKAQPLFESTGNVGLDDAYFEVGKKDGWSIKAGRFEAFDMFPVGLDVFLEYTGDTANDLYFDSAPYTYQLKEGRGRGSDGQLMYSQNFGNLYVEVGSMLGDRSNLFNGGVGGTYHGDTIAKSKDAFILRPVVAYQIGDFRLAGSVETNLVSNAIVTDSGVEVSDRTGYGMTGQWATDNVVVNLNFAYMDAVDENNMSVGVNAMWDKFGIGYVYSKNDYDNDEISNWIEGDVTMNTWYASYKFDNVLDLNDFSVLLGSYYTCIENNLDTQVNAESFAEDDDFGARVRLFYAF